MSYVCLQAEECRVFIKNGKLRFQARRTNDNGDILEQVTVSLPKEMAHYFTKVENFDELNCHCNARQIFQSRIKNFLTGDNS